MERTLNTQTFGPKREPEISNQSLDALVDFLASDDALIASGIVTGPIAGTQEKSNMLPNEQDNPNGLHQRYIVRKANGDPVDPRAIYFVLRLDGDGDDIDHIAACRAAARRYVERLEQLRTPWLQQMTQELRELLDSLDGIVCRTVTKEV